MVFLENTIEKYAEILEEEEEKRDERTQIYFIMS